MPWLRKFEVPGHRTQLLREDTDKIFKKSIRITSGDLDVHGFEFPQTVYLLGTVDTLTEMTRAVSV